MYDQVSLLSKLKKRDQLRFFGVILLTTIFCSSCQHNPSHPQPVLNELTREATVTTTPAHADVTINAKYLGKAPVNYSFNFTQYPVYTVSATASNYLKTTVDVEISDVDRVNSQIHLTLEEHPFITLTSTKFAANSWLRINMKSDVLENEDWNKLTALIKTKRRRIQGEDPDKGIIQTKIVENMYLVDGRNQYIRSSVKTEFIKQFPVVVMGVYLQSEVSHDGVTWTKFGRVIKQDALLVDAIKRQFGVRN